LDRETTREQHHRAREYGQRTQGGEGGDQPHVSLAEGPGKEGHDQESGCEKLRRERD
jgi:hypothetical protein